MKVELSRQELEIILRCVTAHRITLTAIKNDPTWIFDDQKKYCEKIYKKNK